MFGPNQITKYSHKMKYSHRTEKFKSLYKKCTQKIIDKFSLQDYDLIFVPGSGTTGMETVISSLKTKVNVIGPDGKFKQRWLKYCENNERYDRESEVDLYCQLETSTGEVFCSGTGIVDAISSFPYYDIPKGTKCFVTCSNKQLGGFPGLSLVFVKKDSWDLFEGKEYFCTKDLLLYKKMQENNQTPTTCPVQIFKQLVLIMDKFDLQQHRQRIDRVCNMFSQIIEPDNQIPCPVINIPKSQISKFVASKYELYNHNNEKDIYQIFSYSNKFKKYKKLYKDIVNEKSN